MASHSGDSPPHDDDSRSLRPRTSRKKTAQDVAGSTPSRRSSIPINPKEPVIRNWGGLSTADFEEARLKFNPYEFGQRTCSDARFYCKMHQVMHEFILGKLQHTHVDQHFFDIEYTRNKWPEVMTIMDYHNLTPLMGDTLAHPYSPELLREFYSTVHFASGGPTRLPPTLIWMSGGTKCEATMDEFGAILGIPEYRFDYTFYFRIHGESNKIMKAKEGIRHCYPEGTGSMHIPKIKFFSEHWYMIHAILRNTINAKFGEKGEVRKWMINLLFHIESRMQAKKQLDVLDYMWQEMQNVVKEKRVPIYGSYIQRLIETRIPEGLLNNYAKVTPKKSILMYDTPVETANEPRPKRTRTESITRRSPSTSPPPETFNLKKILQKMNCFFIDKQHQDYEAYRKGKASSRRQRAIQTALHIPLSSSSSDEISEEKWKSKHTYWCGDDVTSLGSFAGPYTTAEASSSQAPQEDFHEDEDEDEMGDE